MITIIIKDRDTKVEIKIIPTTNNIGLNESDYWCNVEINIKNIDIDYKDTIKAISKNELLDLTKKLEQFIKRNSKYTEKIIFIKNFFIINLINKETKILELVLVSIDKTKRRYSIKLENDEVIKALNFLENLSIN